MRQTGASRDCVASAPQALRRPAATTACCSLTRIRGSSGSTQLAVVPRRRGADTIVEIAFPSGKVTFQYGHPKTPGASTGFRALVLGETAVVAVCGLVGGALV